MNGKLIQQTDDFIGEAQLGLDALLANLRNSFCTELNRVGGTEDVARRAHWKADQTWVTEMDHLVHSWLLDPSGAFSLRRLVDVPIVSEEEKTLLQPAEIPRSESAVSQVHQRGAEQSSFFWLVDPIDGTRDLVEGRTGFAVSIALMRMTADHCVPVLGGILHPISGAQWVGASHLSTGKGLPLLRRLTERIAQHAVIEDLDGAAGGRKATRSNAMASDRYLKLLSLLGVSQVTKIGSAVKFCLLLEGHADFYLRLGRTAEWDTAGGDAILRSLGSSVIDLGTFLPLQYCKKEWLNSSFLACRPGVDVDRLLTEIRHALAQI